MTIPDDALRFLLTYWHSRKGRADVPRATALMPEDMRPALGHIMLVDLVDDGWDGIFRLYGTKVAERYGRDLTGYRISNVDGGTYISTFFRAINRLCYETRQPIYSCHQPPAAVSVTYWRRLCMPLADAEGNIIRLLIGTVAGPWRAPGWNLRKSALPPGIFLPAAVPALIHLPAARVDRGRPSGGGNGTGSLQSGFR